MSEPTHDHEFEELEADSSIPPRPEEAAADAVDGKTTPPAKGEDA